MSQAKYKLLIERLSKKTQDGQLKWERTVDEGVFQTAFPSYSIRIFSRPSRMPDVEEGTIDYVLQIVDVDGSLVEELDDYELSTVDTNAYSTLREIYGMARRSAMGVDKALDRLLSELE